MTMTTYAKLKTDGTLDTLRGLPNVSNPTEQIIAAYAEAHGYKRVEETARPGEYYDGEYTDTGETIVRVWVPWDIDRAKASATQRVQEWLSTALHERATVPCEGIPAGIVYDLDACLNAVGMQAAGAWAGFIDADNNLHDLDAAGVAAVAVALTAYRTSLYTKATTARAAISAAETVDAVEAAIRNL